MRLTSDHRRRFLLIIGEQASVLGVNSRWPVAMLMHDAGGPHFLLQRSSNIYHFQSLSIHASHFPPSPLPPIDTI